MTQLTLWTYIDLSCDGIVCPAQQRVVGRSWVECTSQARRLGWDLDVPASKCLCPACANVPANITVH